MGEYVMARKLALFATFFNTLMGTRNQAIFSKLYFENNLKQLNAFIKMQCRIAFFLTFLSGFAILILSYYYINWLGNDFTNTYFPLSILLLGEIIVSTFGNVSLFLPVTGAINKGKKSVWLALLFLAVTVPFIWPLFGAKGMAICMVLANLIKNLVNYQIVLKEKKVSFFII
jgi:O-antigen/teichoic acid export membrane protein